MKSLVLAALAASAIATTATAGEVFLAEKMFNGPQAVKTVSGSDVAGCTYRRASTGEQVCDPKSTENTLKDGTSPQNYPTVFAPAGGGEQ